MPNSRLVLIGIGAIALVIMSVYGSLVLASPGGGVHNNSNPPSVQLNGAGATLAYPLLSLISGTYTQIHPNVNINYQPIGSTGGVNQLLHKTVDFSATYPPMNTAQRAKATPPGALHIPEAISALAIAYNIRSVPTGLHLTGPILAAIYLGNITTWSDPAITSINPGVSLPSETIETIHQEEGDGTTYVFTSYLNQTSPKWAQLVGAGTFVQWPPLVPNPPDLHHSPVPDIGLSVSSSKVTLKGGDSTKLSIQLTSNDYFKGIAYLVATSISGVKLSYSNSTIPLSYYNETFSGIHWVTAGNSTLTLTTDASIPIGDHNLVVAVFSSTLSHSLTIVLTVKGFTSTTPSGPSDSRGSLGQKLILGLQPMIYFGIIAGLAVALAVAAILEMQRPKPTGRRVFLEDASPANPKS